MRIERDEGDFVSRFIGLAFRHWRNPGEKKEGTCIEQKGDKKNKNKKRGKRGEKDNFLLLRVVWSPEEKKLICD